MVERTRLESKGFRRHCGALERAVTVTSRSGWRTRRFALEVNDMNETIDVEGEGMGENFPSTLIVSPAQRRDEVEDKDK